MLIWCRCWCFDLVVGLALTLVVLWLLHLGCSLLDGLL